MAISDQRVRGLSGRSQPTVGIADGADAQYAEVGPIDHPDDPYLPALRGTNGTPPTPPRASGCPMAMSSRSRPRRAGGHLNGILEMIAHADGRAADMVGAIGEDASAMRVDQLVLRVLL